MGEVATVLGARVGVAGRVGALIGAACGLFGRRALRECGLDSARAKRCAAHVHERDVRSCRCRRRDGTDDRPVLRPAVELLEPEAASRDWDADLGEQLVRLDRRLEEPLEEVRCRDLALAVRSRTTRVASSASHDGWEIRGGIAVDDRPADGAAVADLGVTDLACRVGDDRAALAQHLENSRSW